jgi:glyoxylase-like metal-dependent hydrolase (beta-lactamase superfamily II)
MKISRAGRIIDGFYVAGSSEVPVYLLDGPKPALFDAGFTVLALLYERDISKFLGSRVPEYLFLTHAHWDHIGAARYFKDVWQELKIAGSSKIREILTRPRVIQSIRTLNQEAARLMPFHGGSHIHEAAFEPFDLDLVLSPGQVIELGPNLSVKALLTPGHTWDFLSYWIPEKKILIASEAVGFDHGTGQITPDFVVGYDAYRNSLELLRQLDARVLCVGHRLVVTGRDVREYIRGSLEHAAQYVARVEAFLQAERGDIAKVVARVKASEWDPLPLPKQPEKAYFLSTRARVKNIWERMQAAGGKTALPKK